VDHLRYLSPSAPTAKLILGLGGVRSPAPSGAVLPVDLEATTGLLKYCIPRIGYIRTLGQELSQLLQFLGIGVGIQPFEPHLSGLNDALRRGKPHLIHVEPDRLPQHLTCAIIHSL
jgi:hypothetical protein